MLQRPRGSEYLEDRLLAEQLDREENEKVKNRRKLDELQEMLTLVTLKFSEAQEYGLLDFYPELHNELLAAQLKLADEEKRQQSEQKKSEKSSTLAIAQKFEKNSTKNPVEDTKLMAVATPVRRVFTVDEMKAINAHYDKLPPSLQHLMEAAICDTAISLELSSKPVFLLGEGVIYDEASLMELLKEAGEHALTPHSRKPFKASQIIPCNTLLAAMEILLDVIKQKDLQPVVTAHKLSSLNKSHTRKRIPIDLVLQIEKHYYVMEDKHKRLFDAICRDPKTNVVMDDPVFLPDGYVYDRSTALAYLEHGDGRCPLNQAIQFDQNAITPCYFVIQILEQLKQNIEDAAKVAQKAVEPKLGAGVVLKK